MPVEGEIAWPPAGARGLEQTTTDIIPTFPAAPRAQLKSKWCWAAVCEAVATSRGRAFDQSAIVRLCLPGEADDNQTFFPHSALKKLNAEFVWLDSGQLGDQIPASCTVDEVIITVSMRPGGQSTHAVCAFGLARLQGELALVIFDPLPTRAGAEGRDLIKIVPVRIMEGGYLEGHQRAGRGLWRSAIRVTGFRQTGHGD